MRYGADTLDRMGFVKDMKAESMAKDAQKAWDDGARFFTPLLNLPMLRHDFSGAIKDWPPMIEAAEACGWKMHTWAVGTDDKGRPQAMPLFVRP